MTVKTGSMEKYKFTNVNEFDIKSIPVDSMIFIELTPNDIEKRNEWFNSLKVGDVLTPGAKGILEVGEGDMKWQVVKVYTMPDNQKGVKIMRIA